MADRHLVFEDAGRNQSGGELAHQGILVPAEGGRGVRLLVADCHLVFEDAGRNESGGELAHQCEFPDAEGGGFIRLLDPERHLLFEYTGWNESGRCFAHESELLHRQRRFQHRCDNRRCDGRLGGCRCDLDRSDDCGRRRDLGAGVAEDQGDGGDADGRDRYECQQENPALWLLRADGCYSVVSMCGRHDLPPLLCVADRCMSASSGERAAAGLQPGCSVT